MAERVIRTNPIYNLVLANQTCADCSEPVISFVRLHFGVFICSQCADIHKSTLLIPSEVKPVEANFSPNEIEFLETMGNEKANSILEVNIPEDVTKPNSNDTADIKQSFIFAKYDLSFTTDRNFPLYEGEIEPIQTPAKNPLSNSNNNAPNRPMKPPKPKALTSSNTQQNSSPAPIQKPKQENPSENIPTKQIIKQNPQPIVSPIQKPKQENSGENAQVRPMQVSKRPPIKVAVFPMMTGASRPMKPNNSEPKFQNSPMSSEKIINNLERSKTPPPETRPNRSMTSATPRVMSPPPDLGPKASTLRTGGKRENKNEPTQPVHLNNSLGNSVPPAKRTANASKVKKPSAITGKEQEILWESIRKSPENMICADYVRFVSVSLGVFLCGDCASIHESLGVPSKLREVSGNEKWEEGTLEFLSLMGNESANNIWEHKTLDQYTKPHPSDKRLVKEKWIHLKYLQKTFADDGFVNKKNAEDIRMSVANPHKMLFKAGYLTKRGVNLKSWKKRWCVLKDNFLFYYKEKGDENPAGAVALAGSTVKTAGQVERDVVTDKILRTSENVYSNTFEIATPQRVYVFHSDTLEDMNDWLSVLQKSLEWMRSTKEIIDPRLTVQYLSLNPDKQGFLFKQSETVLKDFKRMWFALQAQKLFFFKTRTDPNPLGEITLKGASINIRKNMDPKNSFEVYTPGKIFVLYAETSGLMHEWVDAIQSVITKHFEKEMSSLPRETTVVKKPQVVNATQAFSMNNVAKQGFLYKKGKKTMKNIIANITSNTKLNQYISMIDGFEWKKRWFALKKDDLTLYYFVDQQDTIPSGSINVLTCKVMEQSSKENKFIFDIITPYRTYNIYAETKQDMIDWIAAIRGISENFVKK